MDYSNLQKTLAQNKVYDAWQYVESLKETLAYMHASSELIEKVYAHRLETLANTAQQILSAAVKTGGASITTEVLGATKLDIGGLEIDDAMFLKKTTLEFFHYARLSTDILFQIINAALLGDQAISVEDKAFIGKLLSELDKEANFHALKALLDANKATSEFQYLQAFDNHIKHIKTVLVNVNSSFLIGDKNTFEIANFNYGGNPYPIVDAITQVRAIQTYVENTIDGILLATQAQVPNCLGTQKRLQELHFTMKMQENAGKTDIDFISFFIYVNADISELPQEVNVYPLIVKPNDEIYSFDFRCEEIFIKRKTDDAILGVATLKNGLATREVYRSFSVTPCGEKEYVQHLANFKQKYPRITINFYALEGNIICYNPNNAE